jgi:uncharacterized protein YndB with AHSA1/START domain
MNAIVRNIENGTISDNAYGVLTEPTTLTLRRRLPGPIERVWACLTDSKLRRRWLASGEMDLKVGAIFDLTWRNDELTDPPGRRPDGFPGVHTNENRLLSVKPNRRLSFAFATYGEVTFELEPQGRDVLLTMTHRGVADRGLLLIVAPSWHNHLDLLADRLADRTPEEPYWDKMARLQADYERRIPA